MDIKNNMKNTIAQITGQNITENENTNTNNEITNPVVGLISLGVSVSKYFDSKKK